MDYEKKYKALLEQAKEELKTCGSLDCDAAKQIFRFFPELAESEDERMKEAAKHGLQHLGWEHINGIKIKDILAWLEKQGEQKSLDIDIDYMVETYKERVVKQSGGMIDISILNMCLTAFRRGIENTLDLLNLSNF